MSTYSKNMSTHMSLSCIELQISIIRKDKQIIGWCRKNDTG